VGILPGIISAFPLPAIKSGIGCDSPKLDLAR